MIKNIPESETNTPIKEARKFFILTISNAKKGNNILTNHSALIDQEGKFQKSISFFILSPRLIISFK